MELNIKEWLEIAGYPPEKEKEAAIGLGAHFETVVREGDLDQAKQRLEMVHAHYQWWVEQPKPNDLFFWSATERRYRMMIWIAEQTVKIIEDGTFKFPDHLKIDRKRTAAYYTPRSLIEALLDSALQPLIDEAVKGKTAT